MEVKVCGKVFIRDTKEEMIEALVHEIAVSDSAVRKYSHKMEKGDYKHNKTHMKDAKEYSKALRKALKEL